MEAFSRLNRCRTCVLPECPGHIMLNSDKICNICLRHEKVSQGPRFDQEEDPAKLEILRKKIVRMKTEGPYDCAVSISGGKDSVMTLYIAKKILNLNPLAIFIDNGFVPDEMYSNVKNATDILQVDLLVYKTFAVPKLFKIMLESGQKFYYCRVCHALIDLSIRKLCKENNIKVILGGYTKGQMYIKNFELFWIYEQSDQNIVTLVKNHPDFSSYAELFANQNAYFSKHFGNIVQLSPFKYMKWNEDLILDLIQRELDFKLPQRSWPDKSSNCYFNFVAQHLARKQFGYAQHEVELSDLVRAGELTLGRAQEIIASPIEESDLIYALEKMNLNLDVLDNAI